MNSLFSTDFADVKPTILNWMIVGLMAVTFIAAAKFAVNHYDNGVTKAVKPLINAV